MSDHKNDNLQNAEGENIKEATESFEHGYTSDSKPADNNELPEDTNDITPLTETEGQMPFAPEEILNPEKEKVAGETEEALAEKLPQHEAAETVEPAKDEEDSDNDNDDEEAEGDDDDHDHHDEIPEYGALSMQDLTTELEKLAATENVMSVRNHIEEIRKEFYSKYNEFIEEKKEEFSHDSDNEGLDFEYNFPLKNKFDDLYNTYRTKKSNHFKKTQTERKSNLENRLAIIEDLKNLADGGAESMGDALKQVNELREKWKHAGPIPRDKYNHVWNNFHFHLERFYDHLHLDREARDLDFKHNLEQKQKIISRTEELLQEEDVNKAFKELQGLHKIWKEDIGPVSRENREEIWNQFSDLTRQLHDKREGFFAERREQENENLSRKKTIIAQIENIANQEVANHGEWKGQIGKVEALRELFFKAGRVPKEVNEETWAAFKNAVRHFNSVKNAFYKNIKKDQQENLNKKLELVEKANALKDSEDFQATTEVMKQIQEDWKKIGHVPRKYSDKVWNDFKAACNHYFDRLHAQRDAYKKDEMEAFDRKKEYLDNMKDIELSGDHKTDLDVIKKHIENWKALGRVPQSRKHIEGKFNKVLDSLFDKLSMSKKEAEMVKFSNRLEQLADDDDTRRIDNEQIFIMRKIDEVQSEILQLENNIQFISNAKADNPFVKEVNKNIERHKEELKTWKEKLSKIKNLKQE
ncbi:DUF349 domain-containing protein [Flavobacterium rhizosphaerae]|uniref:DUF349 domain-containing protein n=1 Tax=Flavobacterium rhizosphaerae TaxID=3163298 RepID=A0ABW8YWZ1_9FLAO